MPSVCLLLSVALSLVRVGGRGGAIQRATDSIYLSPWENRLRHAKGSKPRDRTLLQNRSAVQHLNQLKSKGCTVRLGAHSSSVFALQTIGTHSLILHSGFRYLVIVHFHCWHSIIVLYSSSIFRRKNQTVLRFLLSVRGELISVFTLYFIVLQHIQALSLILFSNKRVCTKHLLTLPELRKLIRPGLAWTAEGSNTSHGSVPLHTGRVTLNPMLESSILQPASVINPYKSKGNAELHNTIGMLIL